MINRIILGINSFNHDSSATLIKDGRLIAFSEEERFNEQKNTSSIPSAAINYCLSKSNISISDITDIVFCFDIFLCYKSYLKNNNLFEWIRKPQKFKSLRFFYELVWLLNFSANIYSLPKKINAINAKLYFVPHHICHVWYGIYSSNLKNGIVISNDSIGEEISSFVQSWFTNYNGKIFTTTLHKQNSPHSIGYLYGAITEYIGYNRKDGAGKVMAMASYGNHCTLKFFSERLVLHKNGGYSFKLGLLNDRSYKPSAKRLSNLFIKKYPKSNNKTFSQLDFDIARSVQNLTETILTHQVSVFSKETDNIVIAGGVAQNSVTNGKLAIKFFNKNFIIPPIPHDSGCSIGAAVFHYHRIFNKLPIFTETSMLGSEYTNNEIENFLKTRKIRYTIFPSVLLCAEYVLSVLLHKHQPVGIFQGPMECGPRALGNRSIIALPSHSGITDFLNSNVKYREWFRPYGVVTCQTQLHDYFEVPESVQSIPYMTHVLSIKEKYKHFFQGVIHVDGTCRVQTISNNIFYDHLFALLNMNNQPQSVINTSLNVMGKPICRSPLQAIACFFTSGLKSIIFNNRFLVEKNEQ